MAPGELGDVDQTVDATQVDERTEVDDAGDDALEVHALGELGQDLCALGLAALFEDDAAGKHDVVAVAIHLDDASLEGGVDVGGEILHAAQVDQRCRQKATQADVEDKTALDDLDDLALDVLAVVELLLDADPGALVLGTLLGEDETTVLVLLLEHEGLDLVAQADDLGRIDIAADGKLAHGNDALGLEADVKQDLVAVELHDGASDQVAFVKRIDGAIDEGVHLLVGDLGCIDDGRILDYAQEDPFLRGPRISRGERFLLGANRNITVRPIPHATIYCTP